MQQVLQQLHLQAHRNKYQLTGKHISVCKKNVLKVFYLQKGVKPVKNRSRLTNTQRKAIGHKMRDNGEIAHYAEKVQYSRNNDNVKPETNL